MAKSVNKVILVGNVGQDPEVKYTATGVPVAKVSIATNANASKTRTISGKTGVRARRLEALH